MKATKSVVIAALVVGGLLAWNPALRAAETNTPPSAPSAGAPPGGQRPPGLRGPDVDQLAKQLDLTDDQKVKVKTILDAQGKKMRELNADTSLSREEKRPKMQSIREETMTQMKAVLSPEQFEKWQAQRNRRPGGPGGPGGPPPGAPHASGTNAPAAPAKK
jgi:Spy/CpxP family protein refolding chaperone